MEVCREKVKSKVFGLSTRTSSASEPGLGESESELVRSLRGVWDPSDRLVSLGLPGSLLARLQGASLMALSTHLE